MKKYLGELEKWLCKWKIKISVEKSCSTIFSKKIKKNSDFDLRMYRNKIESQKEVKFLGIKFYSEVVFTSMIEYIEERCTSRLNLIKILSNKKLGLKFNTLENL